MEALSTDPDAFGQTLDNLRRRADSDVAPLLTDGAYEKGAKAP